MVIDGAVGFTGGMNVGDEYSGRAKLKGLHFFRDTHLRLEGPVVGDLARIFAEDWTFATEAPLDEPFAPAPAGDCRVQVVPSGPEQAHNAHDLLFFTAVTTARRRVWLQSPYFVPDAPHMHALVATALRGVDVRVMVPKRNDQALVGAAARAYYRELLTAGVRIFEYVPSMLHAKTLVVDGAYGLVGSANVDIRSHRLNFELGALVVSDGFAAELEARFEEAQGSSREALLEYVKRWRTRRRLVNGVARLFSPLL